MSDLLIYSYTDVNDLGRRGKSGLDRMYNG